MPDVALIIDCEEEYLLQRLNERGKESGRSDDNPGAILSRLEFFKEKTLPVIRSLDTMQKLVVIDGGREAEDIFSEVAATFESVLSGPDGLDLKAGKYCGDFVCHFIITFKIHLCSHSLS